MLHPSHTAPSTRVLIPALLLMIAVGCGRDVSQPAASPHPPNFLIVVADDLGPEQVGITAGEDFDGRTPNLDRLGREGLVFERFWSMPSCSPTRAALLTGEYPSRNGIGAVVDLPRDGGPEPVGLPATAFTLPRALAGSGYTSAIAGKWHVALPGQGMDHPLRSGFDHHRGSFANLEPHYFRWFKLVDGSNGVSDVYATTDTTDDAIAFAHELAEPWLIVVAYNAPHGPAHLPPESLHGFGPFDPEQSPLLAYRAMVEAMDTEIGRLLDATAGHDPVVLFLGDNGPPVWAPRPGGESKRAKGTLYEGGIHVPFLVSHSSIDAPGRRIAGLAGVTDVFATVVELSGAEVPPERMPRDSVSLVPALASAGAPPVREWIFAERFEHNGPAPRLRHARTARDARFKLIRSGRRRGQLYDLVADPSEARPVREGSAEAGAARARLNAVLDELPAVNPARAGE